MVAALWRRGGRRIPELGTRDSKREEATVRTSAIDRPRRAGPDAVVALESRQKAAPHAPEVYLVISPAAARLYICRDAPHTTMWLQRPVFADHLVSRVSCKRCRPDHPVDGLVTTKQWSPRDVLNIGSFRIAGWYKLGVFVRRPYAQWPVAGAKAATRGTCLTVKDESSVTHGKLLTLDRWSRLPELHRQLLLESNAYHMSLDHHLIAWSALQNHCQPVVPYAWQTVL